VCWVSLVSVFVVLFLLLALSVVCILLLLCPILPIEVLVQPVLPHWKMGPLVCLGVWIWKCQVLLSQLYHCGISWSMYQLVLGSLGLHHLPNICGISCHMLRFKASVSADLHSCHSNGVGFIVLGHLWSVVMLSVPFQQSALIVFPKVSHISKIIVIWSHILHLLIIVSSCLWNPCRIFVHYLYISSLPLQFKVHCVSVYSYFVLGGKLAIYV